MRFVRNSKKTRKKRIIRIETKEQKIILNNGTENFEKVLNYLNLGALIFL